MKYLAILLVVVLFSANAFSQASQTSVISNTLHNFSTQSWNITYGNSQICQPCHTPHNAKLKMNALWNHEASADNYITWESTLVNGSMTTGEVGETSKKCLDCHDGQIALSAFGGGSGAGPKMTGEWNLGTDLTDDHPVNVSYSPLLSNGSVNPKFEPKNGTYYVKPISGFDGTNIVYGSGKLRLTNTGTDYRVDCTTCHTPHGSASTGKTPYPYLLRMSNTGSALCQTCHQK